MPVIDPFELALAIAGGIILANFISYLGMTMIAVLDSMLADNFGGQSGGTTLIIGGLSLLALVIGGIVLIKMVYGH